MTSKINISSIILGGGCFWCLEAVYSEIQGIVNVISGYSGGNKPNPTYKQVITGQTGHAEVVQLKYDTDIITLSEILDIFFTIHDPTQLNRQGYDVGTQYRSVIFYHSDDQKELIFDTIKKLEENKVWNKPIVTEITSLSKFFPAEDYHQDYFKKNPKESYCAVVISPKIAKVRQKFSYKIKPKLFSKS